MTWIETPRLVGVAAAVADWGREISTHPTRHPRRVREVVVSPPASRASRQVATEEEEEEVEEEEVEVEVEVEKVPGTLWANSLEVVIGQPSDSPRRWDAARRDCHPAAAAAIVRRNYSSIWTRGGL